MTEPLDVALRVARALESVGVEYHLGGSLASSIHGEPRATNDIDLVVDLPSDRVDALAEALGPDFAVDRESLTEAARARASCNIFYLPFFTKVDLFVSPRGAFERSEMRRRRAVPVGAGGETLYVKSAEDTVLRKLLWFSREARNGSNTVTASFWSHTALASPPSPRSLRSRVCPPSVAATAPEGGDVCSREALIRVVASWRNELRCWNRRASSRAPSVVAR